MATPLPQSSKRVPVRLNRNLSVRGLGLGRRGERRRNILVVKVSVL